MTKRFAVVWIAISLACAAPAAAEPTVTSNSNPEAFAEAMDAYLAKDANLEKLANAINQYFMKKREAEQQNQARAEEEEMEQQFSNPVKVEIGKSPTRGPSDAPITIVEFSDFQCPFCSKGKSVMDEVMEAYPGKVKLSFKNLPLPFHEEAKPAAVAALAAGKQGKFWEMHDLLFDNQQSLGAEQYVQFAKQLGLNVDTFKSDLSSAELVQQVEADAAQANSLGVQGTPGFFVNGVQVKGARPLPYFKQIIDRWLAEKK